MIILHQIFERNSAIHIDQKLIQKVRNIGSDRPTLLGINKMSLKTDSMKI